jgi:hypothetical protein
MAQQIVTTSKKFNLKAPDWLKAFIVAAISPVIPIILQSLNAGTFTLDWKTIGTTALASGLAYLAKNFFSPAQTIITGVPAPDATTTVVIPPAAEVKSGAAKPTITETNKK